MRSRSPRTCTPPSRQPRSSKADVLKALFALKGTSSVLGTFGFDKDGDTTLKSCGLYKVGADGMPAFLKTLAPAQVVG